MTRAHCLYGLLMALLACPSASQASEQAVVFPDGATAVTIKGQIKGQEDRRFTLAVGERQVLHVLFNPKNRACYFNAYAPSKTDSAVHIGSSMGHEFGASPAAYGLWRFDVYLMRSAARRNERCTFDLSIELTGAPGGASVGIADAVLRDHCFAHAAPMYNVKKRAIALGPVRTTETGVVIDGTVNKGHEGIKKLRCRFSAERRFIDVMAMTPDGE